MSGVIRAGQAAGGSSLEVLIDDETVTNAASIAITFDATDYLYVRGILTFTCGAVANPDAGLIVNIDDGTDDEDVQVREGVNPLVASENGTASLQFTMVWAAATGLNILFHSITSDGDGLSDNLSFGNPSAGATTTITFRLEDQTPGAVDFTSARFVLLGLPVTV